jgi:preprotein translocase subunit SecF
MMELLHRTNIDFMKYRRFWIGVSCVLMLIGLLGMFGVFGHGHFNLGIDFAGGTQLKLRFREQPQVDQLRSLVEAGGIPTPQIQRFGNVADNQVIVKTRVIKGIEEGSREKIVAALNRHYNRTQGNLIDLNLVGADIITAYLLRTDPDQVGAQGPEAARAHYEAISGAIIRERNRAGIFPSWDAAAHTSGLSPAALASLKQGATLGDFSILGTENVGPQIGEELRMQGLTAVFLSLIGMLVYIWLRFELRFGIGAVMASVHDVLVTLGLFTVCGLEFNLTTVAAFLTLVGYSVNDTVVIFDRIRENMRKNRRKPLLEVMNESINQTLSRTIMTSGLTMLTVVALLILGGDVLRGFSFVMTVGIIVGTYSSIYIASPFALLWEQMFGAQAKLARKGETAPAGVAATNASTKPGRATTATKTKPTKASRVG